MLFDGMILINYFLKGNRHIRGDYIENYYSNNFGY